MAMFFPLAKIRLLKSRVEAAHPQPNPGRAATVATCVNLRTLPVYGTTYLPLGWCCISLRGGEHQKNIYLLNILMYCNGITSRIASQVEGTAYIHVICGAAKAPEPRPWFLAAQCLDEHVPSGAFSRKQITVRGSQCFLKECPPWCGWACPLCLRSCLSVSGLVLSPFVLPFVWDDVSALSPVLSPCFRTCLVSFRASLCVGRRVRLSPVLSPCFRTCLASFRASLCVGRRVRLVSGLVSLFPDLPCVLFIHLMFVQFAATFGLEYYCGSCFLGLCAAAMSKSTTYRTMDQLTDQELVNCDKLCNYVWVLGSAQGRSGWLPRMIDCATWCNYHWSNHHFFQCQC